MEFVDIVAAVELCRYPTYEFSVKRDGRGEMYLQAAYIEPDVVTGKDETQVTRRWLLSPAMTKSEVVQTAFKCIMTSMEHRAREWFTYRGNAIFGPHFDVDALVDLCRGENFSRRSPSCTGCEKDARREWTGGVD